MTNACCLAGGIVIVFNRQQTYLLGMDLPARNMPLLPTLCSALLVCEEYADVSVCLHAPDR